jgi:CheY-like chemotaxis protein
VGGRDEQRTRLTGPLWTRRRSGDRGFRERHLDILTLDIGMPEMDGYEVARRLRALDPSKAAGIVALTG